MTLTIQALHHELFDPKGESVPPIAGYGTETFTLLPSTYSYCGACGYTGRVKGPRQAACQEWIWHAHLERSVELWSPWPSEQDMMGGDSAAR